MRIIIEDVYQFIVYCLITLIPGPGVHTSFNVLILLDLYLFDLFQFSVEVSQIKDPTFPHTVFPDNNKFILI